MKDVLYQYNPWWEEAFKNENVKPREKYLVELRRYLELKQIVILTGLRRVGKTTLMKLIIEEQIAAGVEPCRILYVSLDDYLLHKNNIIEIIKKEGVFEETG